MKIQWRPNWILEERRLCLTRLKWNCGTVGDGKGYSVKLSISLKWEPRDMWIGLFWCRKFYMHWFAWIVLIPCLPIRIHYQRSHGGRFV